MHAARQTTPLAGLALLLVALPLLGALAWPLAKIAASLTGSGQSGVAALQALGDPDLQSAFLHSIAVAVAAAATASLFALPLAVFFTRRSAAIAPLLALAAIVSVAMPPLVTAAALDPAIATATAAIAAEPGTALAQFKLLAVLALVSGLHYAPWLLFTTWLTLRHSTGPLHDAGRMLRVGPIAVARRGGLPAALPGFLVGLAVMMLRMLEDAATPQILGIDELLAPRLLQTLADAPAAAAATALLMTLCAAVVVLLTWRGLAQPPVSRAVSDRPSGYQGVSLPAGLAATAILAATLLPYIEFARAADWVASLSLIAAAGPSLLLAVACGGLVAVAGSVLGVLIARDGAMPRFVQQLACALLILPTPVLAIAVGGQDAGASGIVWSALVALKLLPLAQFLVARRWAEIDPALLDLGRLHRHGGSFANAARLGTMLGPTIIALLLLGMLAAISEVSTALLLLPADAPTFAVGMFQHRLAGDAAWSTQAIVLGAGVAILAVLAMALQRVAAARPPRPRRRRTTSNSRVESHG